MTSTPAEPIRLTAGIVSVRRAHAGVAADAIPAPIREVYGAPAAAVAAPTPTLIPPAVGMAWSVDGFLPPRFIAGAGPEVAAHMAARVPDELTTTFAIGYAAAGIDLDALPDPSVLRDAVAKSTGGKFLLLPNG